MVALNSTAMVGGIIKVMLTLQVSSNDNEYAVSLNNNEMVTDRGFEYFASTEARNWADSQDACRANGRELVILRTIIQKRAFIQYIISHEWRNVNFWIHTCYRVGLVCQRICTEVSVDDQSIIRVHRNADAPCSKQNRYICER